jgi:hypothetical protein
MILARLNVDKIKVVADNDLDRVAGSVMLGERPEAESLNGRLQISPGRLAISWACYVYALPHSDFNVEFKAF